MEWGGKDGRNQAFGQALSDFTFDVACGGAIRHLAHLGYTAKEIHERLSFPVSYERVRQAFTKYLLDTGTLLRETPDANQESQTYTYVQEEGKYGKKSFRRVKKEPGPEENKERIYVACDFGNMQSENDLAALGLSPKQREYLEGICWEKRTMYHLKNERMCGIIEALSARDSAGNAADRVSERNRI